MRHTPPLSGTDARRALGCQRIRGEFLAVIAVTTLAVGLGAILATAAEKREPETQGKPLSAWRAELADADPTRRGDALRDLIRHRPQAKELVPEIAAALEDADSGVRAAALMVVASMGREAKAAVPGLAKTLRDKDVVLREVAGHALSMMGPDAAPALPELIESLKDADAGLRFQCGLALAAIGPAARSAEPLLRKAAGDTDVRVRIASAAALISVAPAGNKDEMIPVLVRALSDKDAETRAAAGYLISLYAPEKDADALPVMIELIATRKEPLSELQSATLLVVVLSLGRMGAEAKPALPALKLLLNHEREFLAQAAEKAIKKIEAPADPPAKPVWKAGDTWTNSVGIKLACVPAGEFEMGSPVAEVGRYEKQETQHHVKLSKPFLMGTAHITRGQFAEFVKETNYQTDAEKDGWAWAWTGTTYEKVNGASWRKPGFPQEDDHPVVEVSWNDAVKYCEWLSKKESRKYRLPTEAEFEYACRAGAKTAYPWGDNPDDGKGWANCADQSYKEKYPKTAVDVFNWTDGYVYTSPAGRFRPNAFGLYDMIGNAWEWCSDCCDIPLADYAAGPATDPTGRKQGEARLLRGGSWDYDPHYCRCAHRVRSVPGDRYSDIGFRLLLDF